MKRRAYLAASLRAVPVAAVAVMIPSRRRTKRTPGQLPIAEVPTGEPLSADAALAPTLPPDLAAVTAAWPCLPAAIKVAFWRSSTPQRSPRSLTRFAPPSPSGCVMPVICVTLPRGS